MSIEVMTWVWKHSKQEGGALLTLLAMADMANDDGVCWPSVATLGQKARLKPRQLFYILAKLKADGDVEVVQQGGGHRSNTYRVITPAKNAVVQPTSPTSAPKCIATLQPIADDPSLNRHRTTKNTTKPFRHKVPERMGLTQERRQRAEGHSVPDSEVEKQWQKFINHYRGLGVKAEDWDLMWDNWCLNFRPSPPSSAHPPLPRSKAVENLREFAEWAKEDDLRRSFEDSDFYQGQLEQTDNRPRNPQGLGAYSARHRLPDHSKGGR